MVIKKHHRCNGDANGTLLVLAGRSIGEARDPAGDVQWYVTGKGAKAAGFRPQQWIAKVHGIWYVRTTGSQRGQYKVKAIYYLNPVQVVEQKYTYSKSYEWSTEVTKATPDQVFILETAEVELFNCQFTGVKVGT